jgi:hypothetical protein
LLAGGDSLALTFVDQIHVYQTHPAWGCLSLTTHRLALANSPQTVFIIVFGKSGGKGPSFVVKDTDTERHREENDGQSHHPSSCVLGSSAASASAGPTFHDGW